MDRILNGEEISPFSVAIIGAGPVGLFAASICGMLGLSVAIFDTLPHVGGQCTALYPQKIVKGIPALEAIKAQDFIDKLYHQVLTYSPHFFLNTCIQNVAYKNHTTNCFEISSQKKIFYAQNLLIATGMGCFSPNKPIFDNLMDFEPTHIHYCVNDISKFVNKNIIIAGGGDSAVDWALELIPLAKSVSLVHRRDTFRCAANSEEKLKFFENEKKVTIYRSSQLKALDGNKGILTHVFLENSQGTLKIPADDLLVFFGLTTNLGYINNWNLKTEKQKILIKSSTFETNIAGIYAVGDAITYENKINLITVGFSEAIIAAYEIKRKLNPHSKFYNNVQALNQ